MAVRERITLIKNDLPHDQKGAFQRLRSEHRKLVLLFEYVTFLQSARTRVVPWSIVPTVERLAEHLLPMRKLLVSCSEEFNYSIRWRPSAAQGSSAISSFNILVLPAIHRLNAFLHTLVAHELFHPRIGDFLDEEQPRIVPNLVSACDALLKSSPTAGPLFERERLDRTVEWLRTIWRRAMEELICDLGCAALFGPAAILAFTSFFLGSDWDALPSSPGNYYPPPRFRLRKTLELAFGADGYRNELHDLLSTLNAPDLTDSLQSLKTFWNLVENETKVETDLKALQSQPSLRIAYEQVEEPLTRAWKFVRKLVDSTQASWALSYKEVPHHLRNLRMNVPCGELRLKGQPSGAASSVAAIFLGAWINELCAQPIRMQKKALDAADEHLTACRIFLKSVEDAELKRTFAQRIAPWLRNDS